MGSGVVATVERSRLLRHVRVTIMTSLLLSILTFEQARLIPADSSLCEACRTAHEANQPHNALSIDYQRWFLDRQSDRAEPARLPTWSDASAHCDPQTQVQWRELLRRCGLDETVVD